MPIPPARKQKARDVERLIRKFNDRKLANELSLARLRDSMKQLLMRGSDDELSRAILFLRKALREGSKISVSGM